jgi:hypothetical protein
VGEVLQWLESVLLTAHCIRTWAPKSLTLKEKEMLSMMVVAAVAAAQLWQNLLVVA